MKLLKKLLSLAICSVMAVSVFAGCGGNESVSDNWEDVSNTEKEVTLKFTHIWSEHAKTFKKICNDFMAMYPNVRVQTNVKSYSNIDTAITSSRGTSQFPDVCFYWVHAAKTLVNEDVTMAADLTDIYYEKNKENLIGDGECMSSGAIKGKTYIVPFRATGFVIYYNADLFGELGL